MPTLNQPNITVATDTQGDEEITLVTERELSDLERAAVVECANHIDVEHVTVLGRDPIDQLLVLHRVDRDASLITGGPMPYEVMYVDERGRVAEAMLNQPTYCRTFAEMVEDVRFEAREARS